MYLYNIMYGVTTDPKGTRCPHSLGGRFALKTELTILKDRKRITILVRLSL